MSQHFYVYPLLFAVVAQLFLSWRMGVRWYWAQIARLMIILFASLGALHFSGNFAWVIIAWGLFVVFVLTPRLLARTAMQLQMGQPADEAARWWQLAGRLAGGNPGKMYRTYAAACRLWRNGDRLGAERLLGEFTMRPMPEAIRGEAVVWKLSLLVASREFPAAAAFCEQLDECGSLTSETHVRLLAARAYAEIGEFERALWNLQLAALSPRTFGPLETQLWTTRVCVAALAGDATELESLLRSRWRLRRRRRKLIRFVAYWRGRCALARGDRTKAVEQLTRASELTHPRDKLWRDAIAQSLHRAESVAETTDTLPVLAAATPGYAAGQQALRLAEQQAAGWRALMHMGQPEAGTVALLTVLTLVFVVDAIVFDGMLRQPLWIWAGNIPQAVRHGEWWRVTTALFLHANLLHLAMNGLALWLFGSAVEKSVGGWRFLVVFLAAGSLGNLLSAMRGCYDVSVGASSGVFGVIAAFAVAAYHLEVPLYASMRRRLLLLIALMVAADLTISGLEPQVDNLAHAGGFAAGLLLSNLLSPRRTRRGERVSDCC